MNDPDSASAQLALELRVDAYADFATFEIGTNRAAIAYLHDLAAVRLGSAVWLYGPSGAGKSHLLQATCRAAAENGRRTMYLSLAHPEQSQYDVLHGLEALDLIALDDADRLAGHREWEESLFGLWNACLTSGSNLVMSAHAVPRDVGFALPDLESRAAGSVVYRVTELDEEGRLKALLKQAARRGIDFDAATAVYLLRRIRQDMREVCRWLDKLDRTSLEKQRRVTIPLIRQILAAAPPDDEEA